MMKNVILRATNIFKSYVQGTSTLNILRGVSLEIREGDAVSIIGSSGAGKSTFLHILGTLDRPDRGELWALGQGLFKLNDEQLAQFRNEKMGFVFQFHHLFNELTALENVLLPARIGGDDLSSAEKYARDLLHTMGLGLRTEHFPHQLSGGELQRVAIARALIRKPSILFADEPTGNLDSSNGQMIQDLFFKLKDQLGLTLIVVTHDTQFARRFPRSYRMQDGQWRL